jgi:gliding motility-associated-like protein
MKMMKLYIGLVFSIVLFQPLQGQIADVTEGCIPLTVEFDGINNLTDYFWDFGDGASSDDETPVHTYTSAGIFQVRLTEGPGGAVRGEATITVYADPIIRVSVNQQNGCAPLQVDFTSDIEIDPDLEIIEYLWTFGDGNTSSMANPSHLYTNAGTYDVSLQIKTNITECDKVEIFNDFITVDGVNATFTFQSNDLCNIPATVTFINTSVISANTTYAWDFGNGQSSMSQNPPPVTYEQSGTYEVSLTTTSPNGCVSVQRQSIPIGVVDLRAEVPDTVCLGLPFTIQNNTGAIGNLWFIGSIGSPSFTAEAGPTFVINNPGLQNIRYTASFSADCTADTTYRVFVEDPNASFILDNLLDCQNPMIVNLDAVENNYAEYIWNGTSTSDPEFSLEYEVERDSFYLHQRDTVEVTLVVRSSAGCTADSTLFFVQRRPNAELTPNVSRGCAPLEVTFSDISTTYDDIVYYKWIYGDGTEIENTGEDNIHTYDTPGEYLARLIIETENGCRDTSNRLTIYVGEEIFPEFSIQEEICLYENISLTTMTLDDRIDSWHYYTDSGRLGDCWTDPTADVTFASSPGLYDVSLTIEYNGCYSTNTLADAVLVKGAKADIGYKIDCEDPFTVNVNSKGEGGTQFTWLFDEFGQASGETASFTFQETGDYTITLIAEDPSSGCRPDTARQVVCIRDVKAVFDLPDRVCFGETVVLDASLSQDVHQSCFTGFFWEFKDNRPRETAKDSIEHEFTLRGENSVILTATDINGCEHMAFDTTMVYGIDADFTVDRERICLPAEIEINNLSTADTTIASWRWNFGSNLEQPGLVTLTNQNFQTILELEVEDVLGCMASRQIAIEEYQVFSDIAIDPSRNGCVGDTLFFTATNFTEEGSFLNFDWNFGPFGRSDEQSPFVVYDQAGTWPVTLEYEEDQSGCGDDASFTVNIVDSPEAAFTTPFDGDDFICFNSQIPFTNTSTSDPSTTYEWTFSDGTPSSMAENPVLAFERGSLEVTLTATSAFGCSDDFTQSYTLIGPVGNLLTDTDSICIGEQINFSIGDTADISSFSIDFGDGTVVNGEAPIEHTYDTELLSGQTIVSLVLRSEDSGCETIVLDSIFIANASADFGILGDTLLEKTYCPDEDIQFINLSGDATDFDWSFGNGSSTNLETPFLQSYTENGAYEVMLAVSYSSLGCSGEITKTINIGAPPLSINDTSFCLSESDGALIINNFNPDFDYYYFLNEDSISNNSMDFLTINLEESTTLNVSSVDTNGCSSTQEVNIFIVNDSVDFSRDTVVFVGDQVEFPLDFGPGYQDSLLTSTSQFDPSNPDILSFIASLETDTLFEIEIQDAAESCFLDTIEYRVTVLDCGFYPTIFTPNGDNRNDFFNIVSRSSARRFFEVQDFKVFDRWGTVIYDNSNPNVGWNGRSPEGEPAPSDVYNWYSQLRVGERIEVCKGNVTLIR